VLPGISPVIGRLEPLWPNDNLRRWDLDAPLPCYPEPPKGIDSRAQVVIERSHRVPTFTPGWK
jgi:alkanesulfonate monooxygenase